MLDQDPIIVFITTATRAEATRVADMMVEKRLAACVQILPEIHSTYLWQGKIEREPETLMLVKTVRARFAQLESEVRVLHSYQTPQIVAVPMNECSQPYLEWLLAGTRPAE